MRATALRQLTGSPQPLFGAAAVAQPCGDEACWKATGTKGYGYKDKTGHTSGTQMLKLGAGATGKAKALFEGKGPLLDVAGLPVTRP